MSREGASAHGGIDYFTVQIDHLTARITTRLADLSATEHHDAPTARGPDRACSCR
ncbi:hypothetical protein [Streptomyces violascens]|uniref:hypothetical protein n=1 Tax=Streptomyces violascens TaxID=67381 RepID=UPI0036549B43